MNNPEPCPTCPRHWEMPPGYLEELVAAKRSTGLDIVDDGTYQRRLAACRACDACVNGMMCMKCGCFVELRALSALRTCPHAEGDRWALLNQKEGETA